MRRQNNRLLTYKNAYSSLSSLPSVGLCFSLLVVFAGTRRVGCGDPTRSRAISRTVLAAENAFVFLFLGMRAQIYGSEQRPANCLFSHRVCKSAIIDLIMDEREFFDERPDKKLANLNCPHCHQVAEYEIQWLVRTKKKSLPPRADDRDCAKFAKAKSYMLRRDDMMVCKNMRCRKRFEISGVQSVAFLD